PSLPPGGRVALPRRGRLGSCRRRRAHARCGKRHLRQLVVDPAAQPRNYDTGLLPVLHTGRTGQSGHFGLRATQTSAPSSITAWLNFQARLPFFGTSFPARPHTAVARCTLPVARPKNTRRSTRATFVSTAGTGFSSAHEATAPAV